MKIRANEHLSRLADAAGKTTEQMTRSLAKALMIFDESIDASENWGCALETVLPGQTLVSDLIKVMERAGIKNGSWELFEDFLCCELMGDGDCPCCGGDLKLYDEIGHDDGSGDCDTPSGWVVDEYVYTCPVCGEIVKSKIEL